MQSSVVEGNRPPHTFSSLWSGVPTTLGLLLTSPLAIASREGAAIGEGMAVLIYGVLALVLTVIVVAVWSGIVAGRRQGAVARQVGQNLLFGLFLLFALPFGAYVVATLWNAFESAETERDAREIKAWLAPLEHPQIGGLEPALQQILQAEQADTPGRRVYLIAVLPDLLQRIEIPLNEQDSAAIRAVASQLRSENTQRHLGSHPNNLDNIDGAVAWLLAKPNLMAALQECGQAKPMCMPTVLEHAVAWCQRYPDVCEAELDTAHLDAAEAWVKHDRYASEKLQSLRILIWLAPLEHPATGGIDQALQQILQDKQANIPGSRNFLIGALPNLLQRIEIPLNDQDRAAIRTAASQLHSENAQRNPGSYTGYLDRLDGAVAWLLAKPNLVTALQECGQKHRCTEKVLEDANIWCDRHSDVCRIELNTTHLDAAEAWMKYDGYALQSFKELRRRTAANHGK